LDEQLADKGEWIETTCNDEGIATTFNGEGIDSTSELSVK